MENLVNKQQTQALRISSFLEPDFWPDIFPVSSLLALDFRFANFAGEHNGLITILVVLSPHRGPIRAGQLNADAEQNEIRLQIFCDLDCFGTICHLRDDSKLGAVP